MVALPNKQKARVSDCVLKPVALYPDSTRKNGFLVMCEVLFANGEPHPSNFRCTVDESDDLWIGFEQEYFSMRMVAPWDSQKMLSRTSRPYYTSIGYKNVGDVARIIVEEHIDICLDAGINSKESTPKWPRDNGSSKYSARDPKRFVTTCGFLVT